MELYSSSTVMWNQWHTGMSCVCFKILFVMMGQTRAPSLMYRNRDCVTIGHRDAIIHFGNKSMAWQREAVSVLPRFKFCPSISSEMTI
uniref:Uncharacterized protein n=1 Tax=Oryza meridionalis TaxID=40149 RepID=A0A0E0C8K8_9ORYZ